MNKDVKTISAAAVVLHVLVILTPLSQNPVPIIQELSTFIGVQRSLKFCEEVATACAFDKLKEADIQRSMPEHLHKTYQKGLSIYRKGG